MVRQHWAFMAGLLILAVVAAACSPATTVPPTNAPAAATTSAPATPAATATTAPTTAPTAAPSATPAATQAPATATVAAPTNTAAPTDTAAPAGSDTPSAPSGTATPVPAPIAHLSAGQVITITSIKMLDAQTGWATGGTANVGDHVLTTGDGGQTWHDVTPPQPGPDPTVNQPAGAVGLFQSGTVAWVVYGSFNTAAPASAVVWRTSNGGQNWTASQPIDLSTIGASDFFQPSDLSVLADGQNGWFLAHLGVGMNHDYFTVMHTADGGQTWKALIDPTAGGPQSCQKTGVHFDDAQNGWLTGDCQGVAPGLFLKRSSDGGATWADVSLPAPASQADIYTRQDAGCGTYSLHFFDAQNANLSVSCLILGSSKISSKLFIYTTADGGKTWTSNPSPAKTLTFIDAQTGWALPYGDFNQQAPFALSMTTDGGKTWKTVKQLAWTGPLSFVDANTGWAVAQADQAVSLVQTTDGGKTWKAVNAKVAT